VDFLTAAPGVTVVDSTALDFDATVEAVLDVVRTTLRGEAAVPAAVPAAPSAGEPVPADATKHEESA
jgi:hypothetical protein